MKLRNILTIAFFTICGYLATAQDFDLRTTQSGLDIVVEIIYTGGGTAPTTSDFLLDLNFELQSTDVSMTFGSINNAAGWGVNTQGSQSVSGGFARRTYGLSNAPINFPVDLSDATYTEIARITTDAAAGSIISVGAAGTHPVNDGIPFLNVNGTDFIPTTTAGAALPVELTYFQAARYNDNSATLEWEAATELDFSHYEIERSMDGRTWNNISKVQGKALNTLGAEYSYLDMNIPLPRATATNVYCRLKMVDNDGEYEYSDIRTVGFESQAIDIEVYPNPTANVIRVDSEFPVTHVSVFNVDGKLVIDQDYLDSEIDLKQMNSGLYRVVITTEAGQFIKSIIKIE